MYTINWKRISEAIEFYKDLDFDYVEVPWKVSVDSAKVTCPSSDGLLEMTGDLVLIASGEQGFIELDRNKMLPWPNSGINYVTCTPCFREIDGGRSNIHHPYFMKVELYSLCKNETTANDTAKRLMSHAQSFMKKYTGTKTTKIVETTDGWDLELAGIEVGSYGYRHHDKIGYWAYGTGLAEPRYSQALEFYCKGKNGI